jgi:ZIP family zinc transporter/zinc and cadmium transporter
LVPTFGRRLTDCFCSRGQPFRINDVGTIAQAIGRTLILSLRQLKREVKNGNCYHRQLHMSAIVISILLGLTAAAANVFGGAIIVQRNWERRYLRYFVALGAGFMLATAMVEMVPESFELRGRSAAYLILFGYLLIHFFEHTVTPHFHFGEETHADEFMHSHRGFSVLLGLIIHTFFDGIAIASGFLVSNALGWLIFLAVFLHKIPEGFTVSSVMLVSGRSRGTAWGASGILGAATVAGVLVMAVFRNHVSAGLPLAAGVTIYVAASDLVPEVNKEPSMKMALLVFVGTGVFFVLEKLLHAH